jgi:hypothetical protein
MARTKTPAPHAARSAADTPPDAAPPPVTAPAGDSPAAAVLAALTAEPGGATVTAIAAQAQITVAAARQALAAHEKAGTATRIKGRRPGIPDTWKTAEAGPGPDPEPGAAGADQAPPDQAPPAQAPASDGGAGPVTESTQGTADAGQPAHATDDGTAGGQAEASAAPGPDPAVTAEAAATAQAVAEAAGTASEALAAGDLPAALAALEAAREQAAQGRRVLKAAATGRRGPATRPGGLRDLVEAHLRQFPGAAFTPHQIGKVLTRSSGAVANALDKLVSLGIAELASAKPRSYRLAPAAPAAAPHDGNPSSTEATPSAA